MRMLIVDDEDSICDFLRSFFSPHFDIHTAPTAERALHIMLEEAPFDILLVDKNLPGMSGVELIRQIRAADDDVSIVMMTAFASSESIVETLNLGIDSYVEKPFSSLEEFGALVDAILSRKVKSESTAPARDPAAVPVIVGAVGDFDRRVEVAEALAEIVPKVACVGTQPDLLALLSPEPDVVLLDTEAWHDWSPAIVEQIAERAPFAACVVLSSGKLSTDALKKLVELGVLSMVMWNDDPDWRTKLVAAVRRTLTPET